MNRDRFAKFYRQGYGEEGIAKKLGISVHYARKYILQFGLKKHPFSRLGQKCLQDTRDKISQAHSGKVLSESHKKSISEGLLGKMSGENNPGWKGGLHRRQDGYVCVRKPSHHKAYSNGYVKRAIIVLEWKLGRPLGCCEVAHHIDGIRDNDSPENLEVMSVKEHNSLTAKSRWANGDWTKRRRKQ